VQDFSDVADQASRVVIFQAPMADQPMIRPARTVITARVGMGGMCSSRGLAACPDRGACGQRGWFQLVHDTADEALAAMK
jgi:hypothetical protein